MGTDYKGNRLEWEEIETEHIIQDEWIDFRRSAYRFPDGSTFSPFYSYSRRNFVVICARDADGNYILVRQYRQGLREVTNEFVAGGIERTDGKEYGSSDQNMESALEAAKRELKEESGYVSDDWTFLVCTPSNPTLADNYAYLFFADRCRRESGQDLDETEFLNCFTVTPQELDQMIRSGSFQQPIHLLAFLLSKPEHRQANDVVK